MLSVGIFFSFRFTPFLDWVGGVSSTFFLGHREERKTGLGVINGNPVSSIFELAKTHTNKFDSSLKHFPKRRPWKGSEPQKPCWAQPFDGGALQRGKRTRCGSPALMLNNIITAVDWSAACTYNLQAQALNVMWIYWFAGGFNWLRRTPRVPQTSKSGMQVGNFHAKKRGVFREEFETPQRETNCRNYWVWFMGEKFVRMVENVHKVVALFGWALSSSILPVGEDCSHGEIVRECRERSKTDCNAGLSTDTNQTWDI